jgi:hypothetical protein
MIGPRFAEPWLLDLCHANGCTCAFIEVVWWGDDDGWPDDWHHENDCPLDIEIALTLLAAGIDPERRQSFAFDAFAYAALSALECDTVEVATIRRDYWKLHAEQGHDPRNVAPINVALLDWRIHHLQATGR